MSDISNSELKELIIGNYSITSKQLDEIKQVIKDLSKQMQEDHDTILLLKADFANHINSYNENKEKEKSYGKRFATDLEALENRLSQVEIYKIKDETMDIFKKEEKSDEIIKESKKLNWKDLIVKIAPYIIGGGVGGGVGGGLF